MAELATPSAATMFDGGNVATTTKKEYVKPEKPDEAVYQANLAKAEKEHKESMAKLAAVKAKLDIAQPKSKDSPSAKRRAELIAQSKVIREQQAAGKGGRSQTFEQIKKLEEQLKSRIAEQKAARSKVAFKSVDELDREIDRLEKQVNGGMMKLVDEKKALTEISNLRKQRKGFAGFEESQKGIDDTKAKLKALRETLDDPEAKALSEKYEKIQVELDGIKAEQDEAYKSINQLRDERTRLQNEQQEKYTAIKKLKDDFWEAGRAIKKYEFEARQKIRERQKNERENYEKQKKMERAQKLLTEASDPAYLDEIRLGESVLRFYDPKYAAEKAPLQAPSQFQATAQRTVDESGLKGTRVVRKDEREEEYFKGTGGKKGKKGRKAAPATDDSVTTPPPATSGKFSCPPAVIEDLGKLGIEPPMNAADVPAVIEMVREKLTHWKADQAAQTERNIAKAKKEVERLDAEDAASSSPAAPSTPTTNGHGESKATASVSEGGLVANELELIKKATEDVVADLKGASLEDEEKTE